MGKWVNAIELTNLPTYPFTNLPTTNLPISADQHRVAVAIEAVAFGDGRAVRREDMVAAGEGGDEHDQRRLGQMEVGHQSVDDAEVEAGIDEEIRRSGAGDDGAVVGARDRFERARRGRADRDDATALAPGAFDRGGGRRGDLVAFRLEPVLLDALDAHGLEGAVAHVQRDLGALDAAVIERGEKCGGEMQAGGRRGDRPAGAGVNG